jgi:hypothetical protein
VRGVSDLIGRIAARAVGAPALAQPRIPTPLVGAGGLEIVDEEVVVPGAAPSAAAHAPASPATAVAPSVSAAPAEPATRSISTTEVPPAAASPGPAAEELPRPERPLPAPERASADPTEVEHGASSAEPRVAATAVPVPATPAAPVAAAPSPVPAAVATQREEPPPVRVHIGRLELRANVQEQPRSAPSMPQPAEAEGLSLSDYLRGRR